MDALTIAAASGMRSRLESLDMLANNLANASAPGFKADREFYNLYMSADAAESGTSSGSSALPVIEKHYTDFAQGSLTPTSNPLDLAISGQGFFSVKGPSGSLYTRDGSFKLSRTGDLQTQEGYPVVGKDNKPIRLDLTKQVEITGSGTVKQDGVEVAQIKLVDFKDPHSLTKQGQNYFQLLSNSPDPVASGSQVQQGLLESANFQTAESAVRLVTVMRQFESLQKAMSIATNMNHKAIDDVARVE